MASFSDMAVGRKVNVASKNDSSVKIKGTVTAIEKKTKTIVIERDDGGKDIKLSGDAIDNRVTFRQGRPPQTVASTPKAVSAPKNTGKSGGKKAQEKEDDDGPVDFAAIVEEIQSIRENFAEGLERMEKLEELLGAIESVDPDEQPVAKSGKKGRAMVDEDE